MVVGAGRGPLVRASLSAAGRAGVRVRVWAVEKNRNAVVTLRHLISAEGWGDRVELVHTDMRRWDTDARADVMVSELLGSFGCNELSPECLDGAEHLLAEGGVSIPCSYTNFLQPVTTSKVFGDLLASPDPKPRETPAVVKLHRFHPLGAPQGGMTFDHPRPAGWATNDRELDLSWERDPGDGVGTVHGLAGYFTARLYRDVTLSTNPDEHTPGMYSWFPIFFPLRDPVQVPAGGTIRAQMWRRGDAHKIWYEWAVVSPQVTCIHNVGGRSSHVGL